MASDVERGGDDERDDLNREDIFNKAIEDGVKRLEKEFIFPQVAEWFLRGLEIGEVFQVAEGKPLDSETGKPSAEASDEVGF